MEEVNKRKTGRIGEVIARRYFKSRAYEIFQADWIVYNPKTRQYILVEVKHQDYFEKPPFDGHGLPLWQVKARLEFERRTGIRAYLFVVDKKTQVVYGQWLRKLEKGRHFDTKGKKPRRIYPLASFQKLGEVKNDTTPDV